MEGIKKIITLSSLKKSIRLLDSFSLRYIPMFFMITIGNGLILKILFNKEVTSTFTVVTILFTSLAVTSLWVSLEKKVKLSIFNYKLPRHIKKKELTRRGIRIFIFYLLLQGIRSLEGSNHIIQVLGKKLVEFSFAITILILITSFIIIAISPAAKRVSSKRR